MMKSLFVVNALSKITETNKFLLFIVLVVAELLIHLGWYVFVLLLTTLDGAIVNQITPVINRSIMVEMMSFTAAMMVFCGFSFWFITTLIEKTKGWLYYQGFFVAMYLLYAIVFAFCIGENTSVVGIMMLSGMGFGLLLLRWRFVLIAFMISMTIFVISVLSHEMVWMQSMPSFYPSLDARSHWLWGISYSWLIIPKVGITLVVVAKLLKLYSLQRMQIYRLLEVDALTAIFNRRSINCYLNFLWEHKAKWSNLSFIYFDLDKFKQINDEYGHDAGDETLKNAANTMKQLLPSHTVFGRIGGEEFCVVLPNVDIEQAAQLAEQLRSEFAKQTVKFGVFDKEIHYTSSFGVACLVQTHAQLVSETLNFKDFIDYMRHDIQNMPSLSPAIEQLLKFADLAMQQAKVQGRNCVVKGNNYLFVPNAQQGVKGVV